MSHTKVFAWTALLAALVVLLGMTPIGLIPLGFINVTILCLPVIIGTLLMGLKPGLALGLAFGGVSTFRLLTAPSTLAGNLLSASPALAILMCILPRLLIPIVSHYSYGLLKQGRFSRLAGAIAAALGSLTNTVFYLGLMLLFYILMGIDSTAIISLILSTGAIAGGAEAAVAALLVPPVLYALQRVNKTA